MKNLSAFIGAVIVLGLSAVVIAGESGQKPPATRPAKQLSLNLDNASAVEMPAIAQDLVPVDFKTPDGREGWVIRIPGNRPIATPAFSDGILFVGGGYGSHEFYAFDAKTGKKVWAVTTADDGPTAAVVEGSKVVFNTESCTVICLDVATGKVIWQEWLGDPLMSQPAISKGHVYIAYPGGSPRGVQRGEQADKAVPAANAAQQARGKIGPDGNNAVGPATGRGHRLLCADLETGKHIWEQDITADVITAPVIDGDRVYFTCFDGSSFCLDANKGAIVWKKQNAGQSAPLIAENKVIMTEKFAGKGKIEEGIRRMEPKSGDNLDRELVAAGHAEYLKVGAGGSSALSNDQQAHLDSSVGFANAPAAANLGAAENNNNISTVAGAWAHQGSRAAYSQGRVLNGQATRLNCVVAGSGEVTWQAEAKGKGVDNGAQLFCPPALGEQNMYVCTVRGEVLCVKQETGDWIFGYATKQPMAFQPALAGGNLYTGTTNGLLICIRTGLKDADGWHAWGGNAQHNKK